MQQLQTMSARPVALCRHQLLLKLVLTHSDDTNELRLRRNLLFANVSTAFRSCFNAQTAVNFIVSKSIEIQLFAKEKRFFDCPTAKHLCRPSDGRGGQNVGRRGQNAGRRGQNAGHTATAVTGHADGRIVDALVLAVKDAHETETLERVGQ